MSTEEDQVTAREQVIADMIRPELVDEPAQVLGLDVDVLADGVVGPGRQLDEGRLADRDALDLLDRVGDPIVGRDVDPGGERHLDPQALFLRDEEPRLAPDPHVSEPGHLGREVEADHLHLRIDQVGV